MPVGGAEHPEAKALKSGVFGAIGLERGAVSVVAETVDLDDQAPVAPEEVDFMWADTGIHVRLGKAVAATEAEEAALELAAGEVRVSQLPGSDQSKIEGSAHGALVDRLGNRAV